jgi:uncharacterized protein
LSVREYGSLTLKEIDAPEKLVGGAVIEGFPGAGLAGAISSTCLISSLQLPLVGELRSPHFPALATVLDGRARAPARVYADEELKLTIFSGDFIPGQLATFEMATAIVDWARGKECDFIVTSHSIPVGGDVVEHELAAVVNNAKGEGIVKKAGIPLANLAAVGGTAARLLLLGREAGIPVIALLVKAHKELQDYEAGVKLAEAIMKLVPGVRCDLDALRGEAQRTEGALRKLQAHTTPPDVYR